MNKLVTRDVAGVRAAGPGKWEFEACPPVVDRHGTLFLPDCWDLSAFSRNPVVLWGHRSGGDPDDVIGTAQVDVDGQRGLIAKVSIHARTSRSQAVADLLSEGVLRAISIGARLIDAVSLDEPQRVKGLPAYAQEALRSGAAWGVITAAELVELSLVPVGSNPRALTGGAVRSLETMGCSYLDLICPGPVENLDLEARWSLLSDCAVLEVVSDPDLGPLLLRAQDLNDENLLEQVIDAGMKIAKVRLGLV